MLVRVRDSAQCPYVLHVKYPGSNLIRREHKCVRAVNHEGNHCSAEGATWRNMPKVIENLEIAGDPTYGKRRIFIK